MISSRDMEGLYWPANHAARATLPGAREMAPGVSSPHRERSGMSSARREAFNTMAGELAQASEAGRSRVDSDAKTQSTRRRTSKPGSAIATGVVRGADARSNDHTAALRLLGFDHEGGRSISHEESRARMRPPKGAGTHADGIDEAVAQEIAWRGMAASAPRPRHPLQGDGAFAGAVLSREVRPIIAERCGGMARRGPAAGNADQESAHAIHLCARGWRHSRAPPAAARVVESAPRRSSAKSNPESAGDEFAHSRGCRTAGCRPI